MEKRRFFLLMMLLAFLMPAMITEAASGSTLLTALQTSIPVILLVLAIIAVRYDPGYALTLIAAAMIVAIFLAGASVNVNEQQYFSIITLSVSISGPTSAYVGQNETYTAIWNPTMPATVVWTVYLNGTMVYNGTGQGSFTYTFHNVGRYLIVATVINEQNLAAGAGSIVVTVTNPPSPLNWLSEAIQNAINSWLAPLESGFIGFIQMYIRLQGAPLELAFYSPTPDQSLIFSTVYQQIQQNYSVGLAMFLLAASVAYNAIRQVYYDIIDLGSDVLYKITVWLMFWSAGDTIYTYAANFINSIIYSVFGPYLTIALYEYSAGLAAQLGATAVFSAIPFFARPIDTLLGDILYLLAVTLAVIVVRDAVMLAIVSLIPLLVSLWLFEWTQRVVAVVIDLLVGLMLAGLVGAATTAFLATLPLGALLFIIAPIAVDAEFLASILLFAFSLRPGEHLVSGIRKRSGSLLPQQPQQQQQQPKGSPTTYM